jgi:hypothetical protein
VKAADVKTCLNRDVAGEPWTGLVAPRGADSIARGGRGERVAWDWEWRERKTALLMDGGQQRVPMSLVDCDFDT